MKTEIKNLIQISQYFGKQKEYVIAGGGNTSYKNNEYLYVKASGACLATVEENDFVVILREKMNSISKKKYSVDPLKREEYLKKDLTHCIADNKKLEKPSVEASLHNLLNYAYVVHTHPWFVNALGCSMEAKKHCKLILGEEVLFIEYASPGYELFQKVKKYISDYRKEKEFDPKIILLENHGIFVSGDNIEEIKTLYKDIQKKIEASFNEKIEFSELPINEIVTDILPAIRMLLSQGNFAKIATIKNNTLIQHYISGEANDIPSRLAPQHVTYCKAAHLYIENSKSARQIIENIQSGLKKFNEKYRYFPNIIVLKNIGIIGIGDTFNEANRTLDTFEDLLKITYYSKNFGGPKPLTKKEIESIKICEAQNNKQKKHRSHIENKVIVITGGAQGFGGGIAKECYKKGANVVVADINEEVGYNFVKNNSKANSNNSILFVKTDVSNSQSVENLAIKAVQQYGGVDVVISNAGILIAGGLDETEPEVFDKVTSVNYKGYFLCAKYFSKFMKIQHEYNPGYYTDIIQINSKSGLKGSNKNFTYAGGKFGGIGLTQSFALELMPYNIKVNSICPGNFFDGPLWSDPKTGLFVQYLNAGKVPGAKSIEDVKKYYEEQVPAKRGCTVEDVMKAIYYAIDQKYETGQAIPVTGGQIMLS